MDEGVMYVQGANLVCHFTAVDFAGSGIDGLTVKFSIFNPINGKYWNDATSAFDSVAEVLNTADIDGAKAALGLYEYALTGGYVYGEDIFRVRVQATQTVTGDVANLAVVNAKVALPPARQVAHSVKKATAILAYKFVMLSASTGDPIAGLTIVASRKLDAAATWSAMTGAIADNGDGAYSIDVNAVDTDGDTGVWKFSAPGARLTYVTFMTEYIP